MRGRTTTTVRFTAARLADLRAAAAAHGRSLSEEVEFRIEHDARADTRLDQRLEILEREINGIYAILREGTVEKISHKETKPNGRHIDHLGLTIPAFAEALNVPEGAARRAVEKGEVETVWFGGLRRIPVSEVDRLRGIFKSVPPQPSSP